MTTIDSQTEFATVDRLHNQADALEPSLRIDLHKAILLARRNEERMFEEHRKGNGPWWNDAIDRPGGD
jgi:hypothetical protein